MCSLSQAGMVRCSGRSVGAEGLCVMAAASLTPRSSMSTPLAKLCAQGECYIKPVGHFCSQRCEGQRFPSYTTATCCKPALFQRLQVSFITSLCQMTIRETKKLRKERRDSTDCSNARAPSSFPHTQQSFIRIINARKHFMAAELAR